MSRWSGEDIFLGLFFGSFLVSRVLSSTMDIDRSMVTKVSVANTFCFWRHDNNKSPGKEEQNCMTEREYYIN
jgi:hypothetical protein